MKTFQVIKGWIAFVMCWEVFGTLLNKYCGKTENASICPCLQALDRFYEAVMQAILRHINFDGSAAAQLHTLRQEITDSMFMLHNFLFIIWWYSLVVKCILVGSPGFVKDQFTSYLFKEAVRQDNKILLENRPKFMMVHSSSGHKYSLKGASWCGLGGGGQIGMMTISHQEVKTNWSLYCFVEILSDPTVTSRLSDTKVILYFVLFLVFRLTSYYIFRLKLNWDYWISRLQER